MSQTGLSSLVRLRGPVLIVARVAWLVTAALVIIGLMVGSRIAYEIFQTPCADGACPVRYMRLSPQFFGLLEARGISAQFFAAWIVALDIVFVLTSVVIASVIFWRKSEDRMALFVSFALLLFGGVTFSTISEVIASTHAEWRLPTIVLSVLGLICFCIFLCVFPNGRFVPRWLRPFAIVFAILNVFSLNTFGLLLPNAPLVSALQSSAFVVVIVLFVVVMAAQVYRYRRVSNATERQQTKWVVFGLLIGIAGYFSVGLIDVPFPQLADDPLSRMLMIAATYGFMLLVPISIGAAILRSRLYDIDILIRRTLIYGALTAMLALVYFMGLFVLQNLVLGLTGQTGSALILIASASTLVLGALSRPLRTRIQEFIDRRFYRRKYDAAKVIAAFGASVRDEVDLDRLISKLLDLAQQVMQPERAFIGVVRDVEAEADPEAPESALAIQAGDPLVAHFRKSPKTIPLSELRLQSAALRAMREARVAVATPLVSQDELVGVLNLGVHLSEQEYSREDRELLDALSAQAAPAMQVAKLVREQRAQEEMRTRIDQELQLARQIQFSLLPKEMPVIAGWTLDAMYQPAREVGGDFYDVILLTSGCIGIAIGDVTGKGMPAALCMATTRTTLRAAAQDSHSPGEVLARVNALACRDIPVGMFVTCLYAILDPASAVLRFANAGQSLPYRYQGSAVTELNARGMPLGLTPDSVYEENTVTISSGEGVLFHTDGVVEAHNSQGDMFGSSRLEMLLATYSPDVGVNEWVRAQLTSFTGTDLEQEDDITMVSLLRGM